MRLLVSRPSAEERLLELLNRGHALARDVYDDYARKRDAGQFDEQRDVPSYRSQESSWLVEVEATLRQIFPTSLEAHIVRERFSVTAASFLQCNDQVGALVYQRMPVYLKRLRRILNTEIDRYSDLPATERLFVEDIDSFFKVRDVNPSMVSHLLINGRIELSEDEVQMALEAILNVPFHKKDWGGEVNDLYTANLVLNGARRPAAFLLKGNGLKRSEMLIADCGKNGDQLLRLFQSAAELFVVQYVGPISEAVIADVQSKVAARRAAGAGANFLIIDGQDTARLLYAFNRLPGVQPWV